MKLSTSKSRVLVFDCECRPTAWFGGDYVGRGLTAVAWSWLDEDDVSVRVLDRRDKSTKRLLHDFLDEYGYADVLVGHYVRGFDFPLVNGECERHGWRPIPAKMSVDTKIDRFSTNGISESLENLVNRYELEHEKIPMREPMWEEFNLWQTLRSVEWVRERVVGDVVATKELYVRLNELGRLSEPKLWDPRRAKMPRYRA